MGKLSKALGKVTKPISEVLDKIVPNEVKPFLPYLAAFAPFMMPPGMQFAQSGIFSNPMFTRALMSGGLNLSSQLAQEGSEGEFSPLSVALASGVGALGAQNAPEFFQGMQRGPTGVDRFGTGASAIEVPYSDTGIMASISDAIGKGGAGAAKFIGEAGEVLRPGGIEPGLDTATLKALSVPVSQGTADLAMADARRALRDYENEMANEDQLDLIDDEGRRRAIRAAMEAAGHLEDTILDALGSLGLKSGGIVGMKHGGILNAKRGLVNGPGGYAGDEDIVKEYLTKLQKKHLSLADRREGAMNWENIKDAFNPIEMYKDYGRREEFLKMKKILVDGLEATKNDSEARETFLEEFDLMLYTTDENTAKSNPFSSGGRISKEGGGVANVLPKGKEADYRGGGVIPIGSRERADDVPARLSKNEFVMTADAVRAAGGGNINQGAKRMYNLMNNLEARV